jgi:hypothetical protein
MIFEISQELKRCFTDTRYCSIVQELEKDNFIGKNLYRDVR